MSRAVTARGLARETLRLSAAFLAGAMIVALVLGALSWSAGVLARAFGLTLVITLAAGLPTYAVFRLFGPLTLQRAAMAGVIVAAAPVMAALAADRLFDPAPMQLGFLGVLVGTLIVAVLGAMGGCGFYLAYCNLFDQPDSTRSPAVPANEGPSRTA